MCICHNVECNCVDLVTCMCIYPWIYVYIYIILYVDSHHGNPDHQTLGTRLVSQSSPSNETILLWIWRTQNGWSEQLASASAEGLHQALDFGSI